MSSLETGRGAAAPLPYVATRSISKRFGGVQALEDITLSVRRGTVHALVGENGAGKSTLGKIISGVIAADEGQLLIEGQSVRLGGPRDALEHGITMIHQEIALVPQLSVLQNVFLGVESKRFGLLQNRRLKERFAELLERSGFEMPADVPVGSLSIADQKKVEILKAVARDARLIVMDEPTAALPDDESERLIEIVRWLRESGATVVYVSHFLEEVLSVADDITVLRNGHLVRSGPAAEETPDTLVAAMLGRAISLTFPEKQFASPDAPVVLDVRGLSRGGQARGGVDDVSFHIRAGEIVGLAGLIGSGRTEVARLIFGANRRDGGDIIVNGKKTKISTPDDAIAAGIAMLPESRKDQGLLMSLQIGHNVTLPHLELVSRGSVIERSAEQKRTETLLEELDVRPPLPRLRVDSLSGGNQQKVLFAKWLFKRPQLLIADEPTHGVDVGAKRAIYELITSLAADGMAVLLISSELEEVLGLSHRVLVMREGRIVAEFADGPGDDVFLSEDAIMRAAFATEMEQEGGAT